MKAYVKKKFIADTWEKCIGKFTRFLIDYNLDLMSVEMHKDKEYYIAIVEYDLGLDRKEVSK